MSGFHILRLEISAIEQKLMFLLTFFAECTLGPLGPLTLISMRPPLGYTRRILLHCVVLPGSLVKATLGWGRLMLILSPCRGRRRRGGRLPLGRAALMTLARVLRVLISSP